jgi:TonB family protein
MRMKLRVGLLVMMALTATGAYAQEQPSTEAAPAIPIWHQAPPPPEATRIRVSGNEAAAKITHIVQPVYPDAAKAARVSGTVILHCVIAKDGSIMQLTYVSGPPLLLQAAMDAVHQWTYQPTLFNGKPVEVDTTISVVFVLGGTPGDPAPLSRPPATANKSESMYVAAPDAAMDPQCKADILHLMDVTHFKDQQQVVGRQMLNSFRPVLLATIPATPNREKIADAYMDRISSLLQSDEFTARVAALYAKDLTDSDARAAAAFYEATAGQHYFESITKMAPDLMAIGQQIVHTNLRSILQDVCKEFPELQGTGQGCAPTDANPTSLLLSAEPISAAD